MPVWARSWRNGLEGALESTMAVKNGSEGARSPAPLEIHTVFFTVCIIAYGSFVSCIARAMRL